MSDPNAVRLYSHSLHQSLLKPSAAPAGQKTQSQSGTSFQKLLENNLLTFSHHAEQRLSERGIKLQPEQLQRLHSAVDKAASKGARESLVLLQDMAFIVNVKQRTIVTAMDHAAMRDHVFTNIDSTVVVR